MTQRGGASRAAGVGGEHQGVLPEQSVMTQSVMTQSVMTQSVMTHAQPGSVASIKEFYRNIWKLFYTEYLLYPFI